MSVCLCKTEAKPTDLSCLVKSGQILGLKKLKCRNRVAPDGPPPLKRDITEAEVLACQRRTRFSRELMRPFPSELMRMWPISTRVNKPENDDPSIVEHVEPATSAA